MASMAYNKALQLDKSNASAQTKLELVKELFGPPAQTAKAKSVMKQATAASPAQPGTAVEAPPVAKPAPEKGPVEAVKAAAASPADFEKLVKAWAAAWSKRDLNGYLAFYADDYAPAGTNRADWVEVRKGRLTKPAFIRVGVSGISVKMVDKKAVVSFKQTYESNLLKGVSAKTLVFRQIGNAWKIVEENS
jgi:hypothetical protein